MDEWKEIDEESTPLDALKVALRMEKKAHEFYTRAMEAAKFPGTKEMFAFLMDEETRHIKIIEEEMDKDFYQEM